MLRLPIAFCLLIFGLPYAHASGDLVLKPVLQNVEHVPSADLNAIVQDLNSSKYGDLDELAEQVRFVFQKYGYFTVQVAEPVMPTADEIREQTVVRVNLVVTPGEKYRLRDIGFSHSNLFSPTELRRAFAIGDGDIFDRVKIGSGLEKLRQIYGAKGYMFFSAVPETDIDEPARTVSLRIDLDEGSIFYAGTLTVRGDESEPGAREKLLRAWKSYEGQVYDLQTLNRFLRDLHARAGVKPEQVFEVSFDEKQHLANVHIYLARPLF